MYQYHKNLKIHVSQVLKCFFTDVLSTKQYRIDSILFERSNAFLFGHNHHSKVRATSVITRNLVRQVLKTNNREK
jgi:GDP-D-mannose dehydratase